MALTYFTLAQLRDLPDVSDGAKYPDARVTSVGEYVEATIERVVGTSFVARTWTDEEHYLGSRYADRLTLRHPHVRSVISLEVDGLADGDAVDYESSVVRKTAGGGWSGRLVVITYTAGYSVTPPADIREAALWATRHRLMTTGRDSAWTGRQTQMNTEQGSVQFAPSGADRPFGLPDVDAVVNGWRHVGIPGVA